MASDDFNATPLASLPPPLMTPPGSKKAAAAEGPPSYEDVKRETEQQLKNMQHQHQQYQQQLMQQAQATHAAAAAHQPTMAMAPHQMAPPTHQPTWHDGMPGDEAYYGNGGGSDDGGGSGRGSGRQGAAGTRRTRSTEGPFTFTAEGYGAAPRPTKPKGMPWQNRKAWLVAVIVVATIAFGAPRLRMSAPQLISPTTGRFNALGLGLLGIGAGLAFSLAETFV